jgi:ribosomal protein S6
MNNKTETIGTIDPIQRQVALLSGLSQPRVIKVKYGLEIIELDLRESILKLGLDLHYRQVTVGMQEEGGIVRAVGKMGYRELLKWIKKRLVAGWQIYSCYEAGASGYWLHRKLVGLGVRKLVVVARAMGQTGKKQKTDRRDCCQLTDDLDR